MYDYLICVCISFTLFFRFNCVIYFLLATVSFEGCGAQLTSPQTHINLEFSGQAFAPVLTRELPVRLEYEVNEAESNEFFTLLFVDAGFSFTHMLIVDIPGNDVTSGRVALLLSLPIQFVYM